MGSAYHHLTGAVATDPDNKSPAVRCQGRPGRLNFFNPVLFFFSLCTCEHPTECNPLNGRDQEGAIDGKDIIEAFSDAPARHVVAAIDSMAKARLIIMDPAQSRLSITQSGVNRLQSTIACRDHQFEHCRCNTSIAGQSPKPVVGRNC
jgi:hypothetical protein